MTNSDHRLPYPAAWVRAMVFETTARQLTFSAMTASQKVQDALAPMEYCQPPAPDDKLADVGASVHQLDVVARAFGMDSSERNELHNVCARCGLSARHAALLVGHALQRIHEVDELEQLLVEDQGFETGFETFKPSDEGGK